MWHLKSPLTLWFITIEFFDQVMILKATLFLEGHKGDKRVTYKIIFLEVKKYIDSDYISLE